LLLLMLLLSLKIPINLWFYFFPVPQCILFKKTNPLLRTFFFSFLSCHSNTLLQTKSDLLKIEWDVIIIIINIDVVRQRVDCIVMRSTIPNADLTIFSFGCLSLKFYIIHAARIRDYKAVPRYIYVDLHLLYKLMLILITKSFRSFETQQLQIHISF
jgi:hypothetical protein